MTGRPCIVCDAWTSDPEGLCETCAAERAAADARAHAERERRLETALRDLTIAAGGLKRLAGPAHRELIEDALARAREALSR